VLVGGVVDHEIEQNPDPSLAGRQGQFGEVPRAAEPRVDAIVVRDVVPVVAVRRRMDRVQPQTGDAEP
jgi:hypothetical protein